MQLSRIIRKTTLLIKLAYTVEKRWRWENRIVFMKLDAQKAASAKHLEEFKPLSEKEGMSMLHYTICNMPNEELFYKQCAALEKNIPELMKEPLLEDVAG